MTPPRSEPRTAKANSLILALAKSAAALEEIEHTLRRKGVMQPVRLVNDVKMALARLAGGGVLAIVACAPALTDSALTLTLTNDELQPLTDSADVPLLLWTSTGTLPTGLPVETMDRWRHFSPETSPTDLGRIFSAEANRSGRGATTQRQQRSTVISVIGAKGGVGTTTVAMNIAAGLTERGRVILAELRSSLGSLQGHFRPGRLQRSVAALPPGADIASLLWPVPRPEGLRILFGPQTMRDCSEIGSQRAAWVLDRLIEQSEFVVLDLPVSLCETNRSLLASSQYVAVVVEATSTCIELGRLTVEGIQQLNCPPASVGAVLVRQRPEGETILPREAEIRLGVPVLKLIPPAHQSCLASEQAHIPLVEYDPESLAAESLLALSRHHHAPRSTRAAAVLPDSDR